MRAKLERIAAGIALAVVVNAGSQPAQAIPLVFHCIAVNSEANCAVGEAQFLVDVVDAGPDEVAFIFTNEGPGKSAIARIYIEDVRGIFEGPAVIHHDAPAVKFANGVQPPNLPGGATLEPAFVASPGLGVSAARPFHSRGVNPGEHVGLVYKLSAGNTISDVISELVVGNLRLGLHAVGFRSRGNESFISQLLLTETLQ